MPLPSGEDVKNKQIERQQFHELKRQDEIIKLLLLGAGESGKSTVFRQMKLLYGKKFTEEELLHMIPVVHANILSNLMTVLQNAAPKQIQVGPKDLVDKFLTTIDEESIINEQIAQQLKQLWNDPGVQQVWGQRSTYQVLDSLEHYMQFDNLDRICKANYVPTEQDILHARVRTSGIVEERYEIDGVQFTMFDVGGQRNERKKWIHAFSEVTGLIFVAAINEYDQVLYEDNRTARVAEALKLFDEICNSQWFEKTSIILFLNKNDLFREKLARIPFRVQGVRNEDFLGPFAEDQGANFEDCVVAARQYTAKQFTDKRRDASREVYVHFTEAINTQAVAVVFNACKDIILRSNLVESGFLQ
ncbi:hypothetical protein BASA81_007838 [Batrachochytrium salamandrivorans]|nr:hypothetical protein BASA81_007838 [Batrachochytrium salamandrivorans]